MVFYNSLLNVAKPKRLAVAMLLAANGMGVWADNKLYIDAQTVTAGDQFDVQVLMENDYKIRSMQTNLVLPEGLEIVKAEYQGRQVDFVPNTGEGGRLDETYELSSNFKDGKYIIMISSLNYIQPPSVATESSKGEVFHFTLKAKDNLKGDAAISLENQKLTTTDGQTFKADEQGTITVLDPADNPTLIPSAAEEMLVRPFAEKTTITLSLKNNIPVAGFEAKVRLPQGVTKVGDFRATDRTKYMALNKSELTLAFLSMNNNIEKGEGAVFEFDVESNNDLADGDVIEIYDIKVSRNDNKPFYLDNVTITVKNPNAVAKVERDAEVEGLQDALQQAKDGVDPSVREDEKYTEETNDVVLAAEAAAEEAIEALVNGIQESYDKGTLDLDAEAIDELKAAAEEAIANVVKAGEDAKALLDQLTENDAVYEALQPQLADLDEAVAAAKAYVEENAPDVTADFEEAFAAIDAEVEDLKNGIEEKHEKPNRNLNAEDQAAAEEKIAQIIEELEGVKAAADEAEAKYLAYQDLAAVKEALEEAVAEANESDVAAEPEVTEAIAAAEAAFAALQETIDGLDPYLGADYSEEKAAAEEAIAAIPVAVQEATDRLEAEGLLAEGTAAAEEAINAIREEVADDVADLKQDVEDKLQALNDLMEAPYSEKIEDIRNAKQELDDAIEALIEGELAAKAAAEQQALADALEALDRLNEKLAAQEASDAADDYIQSPEVIKNLVDEAEQAAEEAVAAIMPFIEQEGRDESTDPVKEGDLADPEKAQHLQDLIDAADAAIDHIADVVEEVTARKQASQEAYDRLKAQVDAKQSEFDTYVRRITLGDGNEVLEEEDIKAEKEAVQQMIDDLYAELKNANEVEVSLDADSEIDDELQAIDDAIDQFIINVEKKMTAFHNNDIRYAQLRELVDDLQEQYQAAEDAINAMPNVGGNYAEQLQALKDRVDAIDEELETKNAAHELKLDTQLSDLKPASQDIAALLQQATASEQAYEQNLNELETGLEDLKEAYEELKEKRDNLVNDNEFITEETPEIQELDQQLEELEGAIQDAEDDLEAAKEAKNLDNQDVADAIGQKIEDAATTAEELDETIDQIQEAYDNMHVQGDITGDGVTDIEDWYALLDIVLDKSLQPTDTESEDFKRLDVNGDGQITVSDLTAIVNIYIYGKWDGLATARAISNVAESATLAGSANRVAINLNSANQYVAAQIDVNVPEGMTVKSVTLGERAANHKVSTLLKDGKLRVVIASLNNAAFEGADGALAYIEFEGNGQVSLNEFIASDAAANAYAVVAGSTTGISNVEVAAKGEQVYSLGGRMMNALKKGLNIIRRADGTTQKVIK